MQVHTLRTTVTEISQTVCSYAAGACVTVLSTHVWHASVNVTCACIHVLHACVDVCVCVFVCMSRSY